jgi:hypothetical protein
VSGSHPAIWKWPADALRCDSGIFTSSVQVGLPVHLDDAVGRRVRDAGERVPGSDLTVVEERLVLAHAALQDLAGARGARALSPRFR